MTSHGDPVFPCGTIEAISVLTVSLAVVWGNKGARKKKTGFKGN